ncbi:MAG: PP2C family protein-serine/threonine phosphatase [Planctomycetota bacterium]
MRRDGRPTSFAPAQRAGRAAFLTSVLVALVAAGALWLLVRYGPLDDLQAAGTVAGGVVVLAWIAGRVVQGREWRRRRIKISLQRMAQKRRILEAQIEVLEASLRVASPEVQEPDSGQRQESRDDRWSREIQAALLPARAPPLTGYHLEVLYRPCGTLGGDFYDFCEYPDGRVLVTLGDVSGKGASGAIVMAMVQTLFRQHTWQAAGPADLLARVNEGFLGALGKGIFVTALAGVIDPAGHTLTLAGAGHHPVMLFNAPRRRSSLIQPHGAALGLVPGASFCDSLTETRIDLAPDDALLFYTDGASEGVDSLVSGTGENRLRAAAAAAVLEGARGALGRIRREVWRDVPARDDSTLLLVARLAEPEGLERRSARTSENLRT